MNNTPETDKAERMAYLQEYMVPTDFARKLERERDEARKKLEDLQVTSIHSCHNECQRPMCVLRRDRNEARENYRLAVIYWQRDVAKMQQQRDEAIKAFKELWQMSEKLLPEINEEQSEIWNNVIFTK
jgi:hypothetical protein